MKLVDIKQKIKHDSQVFYPGERRMVEDDVAALFCQHGWAEGEGLVAGAPDVSPKVLAVNDGKHTTKGQTL